MIIDKLVISLKGRLHTIYFLYAQHYYQVSCLPNVYYCYDLFLKLIYRLWLCMLEYCHVVLSKLNNSFVKVLAYVRNYYGGEILTFFLKFIDLTDVTESF